MPSINQSGFEKPAAQKRVSKIMLDMRLTPVSGTPLHCFVEETNKQYGAVNAAKIIFSVSANDFSGSCLSALLAAFELRVEIQFPV
jgi:hypothetical protein